MEPFAILVSELMQWVYALIWPLIRILAMISISPVLGGRQVPNQVKIILGVTLTLLIVPQLEPVPVVHLWTAEGLYITLMQVVIGIVMGFTLLLIFEAINMAGHAISTSMGLAFSMTSDPQNGFQITVVSQFLGIIATLLFLSLNGHHALIGLIYRSFIYVPVGSGGIAVEDLYRIVTWSSVLFSGAIAVALPAIIALLSTNLVMGVMTRTAPQLNIFSIGFPMTMMMGFISIVVSLPNLLPIFEQLMADAFSVITAILGG